MCWAPTARSDSMTKVLPTMPKPTPQTSLYRTIYTDVVQHIHDGTWAPGHRVPSEMELSERYDCSRMTVNKALSQLAAEGYIERRRRAGSVVAQPRVQSAVLEIHDIKSEVAAIGESYGYHLISRGIRALQSGDEHFSQQHGPLLHLVAVHLADGKPFCLEERWISLETVPEATDVSFEDESPGAWLLQQVPWNQATHTIRALGADTQASAHLQIAPGAPCLAVERRTWNTNGSITEVRFTYPGDRHLLTARFTPPGPANGSEAT